MNYPKTLPFRTLPLGMNYPKTLPFRTLPLRMNYPKTLPSGTLLLGMNEPKTSRVLVTHHGLDLERLFLHVPLLKELAGHKFRHLPQIVQCASVDVPRLPST